MKKLKDEPGDEVDEDAETVLERATRVMLEYQDKEIADSVIDDERDIDDEQHAWRQLAFADRKMLSNLARADGDMTAALWKRLVHAYRFECAYCRRCISLVVEHMTPVSRGGRTDLANIAPSCNGCNRRKASRTIEEQFPRRAKAILDRHAMIVARLRRHAATSLA